MKDVCPCDCARTHRCDRDARLLRVVAHCGERLVERQQLLEGRFVADRRQRVLAAGNEGGTVTGQPLQSSGKACSVESKGRWEAQGLLRDSWLWPFIILPTNG